MRRVALFQILGSFKLTGRGFVIYGDVKQGQVTKGDIITFLDHELQRKLKIDGIEMLDPGGKVCLVFLTSTNNEHGELLETKLREQSVEITKDDH